MARKLSSREAGLLVALGALAAAYLWYSSRQGTPTASAAGVTGAKGAAGAAEKPPEVRMDLLAKKDEGYNPEGRDLFKYSVRPPTAEELRRQREEQMRQQKLLEAEAKARAEAVERARLEQMRQSEEIQKHPPMPQPPPISLQYVGYIGPKTDKVAVFQDGEEVLVAKKGETVKGQFKVVDIKLESVVMGYTRSEFKNMTRELTLTPASR